MATTYAVTISTEAITAQFDDGQDFAWPKDHPNFEEVKAALKRGASANELLALMDTVGRIQEKLAPVATEVGLIVSRDGVMWHGKQLHMTITDRIVQFISDDLPVQPLVAFLEKLLQNQRRSAVMSLFDFLEANKIPVTGDGDFLTYKRVRSDYKDIHSGSVDNRVGQTPHVDPWEVDEDRDNTCSNGLHVCARHYLPSFGSSGNGDRVVICKVNPAHVVAVPRDYNNSKMRVFQYEVIGELTDDQKAEVLERYPLVVPGTIKDEAFDWGDNFSESDPEKEQESSDYYNDDDDNDDPEPCTRCGDDTDGDTLCEECQEADEVESQLEEGEDEPSDDPAQENPPKPKRWWFR